MKLAEVCLAADPGRLRTILGPLWSSGLRKKAERYHGELQQPDGSRFSFISYNILAQEVDEYDSFCMGRKLAMHADVKRQTLVACFENTRRSR